VPALQAENILETLKRVAAALRAADVPFALAGGLAAWARGGPPTEKDVDLLIRPQDAERAHEALAADGLRIETPPEGWLVKAYDGDILVDLIFEPTGLQVDDALLERCDVCSVHAVPMAVMRVDDLLASKLLALTEHHLDFGAVLEIARALREQIDWPQLRGRTMHSPFARAFFVLLEELGICEPEPRVADGHANGSLHERPLASISHRRQPEPLKGLP
jgi:hypothetical protein